MWSDAATAVTSANGPDHDLSESLLCREIYLPLNDPQCQICLLVRLTSARALLSPPPTKDGWSGDSVTEGRVSCLGSPRAT